MELKSYFYLHPVNNLLMKKIQLIILGVFTLNAIKAQIISAGTIASFAGSVSNSNITLDYSVGENIISTLSNATNCVTQGFLQPHLIISTGIVEVNENNDVSVYPNPTSDFVLIKSKQQVTWIVYDTMGKIVLMGDNIRIETAQFAIGVYYLEISNKKSDNKKTIKLIKN
jgi:hypothetical protein